MEHSSMRGAPVVVVLALASVAACASRAPNAAGSVPTSPSLTAEASEAPEQALPRADSVEAVRDEMASRGTDVRRCYTRELRNEPTLRGKLLVQFTVHPDGAIGDIRIRRDTVRSPRVRACVTTVIGNLRFASGPAQPMHFRYPFVFAPN